MFTVTCRVCGHDIPMAGDRIPPWCPKCGADVRPGETRTQPKPADRDPAVAPNVAVAPTPAPPAPSLKPPPPRLPYFHAHKTGAWRSDRVLYRVYVTDKDLLFLSLGTDADDPRHVVAAAHVLGGLVGGLLASAFVEGQRHPAEDRQRLMNLADEPALRQLVVEIPGSFELAPDDLASVAIDPKSFWAWAASAHKHVAILKLMNVAGTEMKFELPGKPDLEVATEFLPRLLGNVVTVNV
jgi:hypothetical protein